MEVPRPLGDSGPAHGPIATPQANLQIAQWLSLVRYACTIDDSSNHDAKNRLGKIITTRDRLITRWILEVRLAHDDEVLTMHALIPGGDDTLTGHVDHVIVEPGGILRIASDS
jgi:hypothetical protein